MKRLTAIILTLVMMFSLVACKENSDSNTPPSTGTDLTQREINKILKEMEEEEAE